MTPPPPVQIIQLTHPSIRIIIRTLSGLSDSYLRSTLFEATVYAIGVSSCEVMMEVYIHLLSNIQHKDTAEEKSVLPSCSEFSMGMYEMQSLITLY